MTISQIKENTEFLVEATRLENLDLVDFILQQGKPVDVIKALSIVKKSQNTAIFEKLLSYLKMHPEMLKKGVEIKDSEILDTLLQIPFEERAEWQVPELKNNYLIHYAVLKNNHSLLTKALDKKIDVDALNMQQESALEIAIQKDHTSLIKTLLEHGAKKCKNPEKYFIKLINDREPTIASLLLESIPFEVGAEDDLGKTAFHYALIKGYKFLAIQIIGKIENPVKTSILNTALDWAISAHLHNEVMFIIKQGATNSRYSSDYLTSIMRNDDVASAIIFIDSLKCQFYFNNQIKDTALHYIVEKNQLLLLKKTLNKMAGDNQETLNSALSLAMKCNDLEIIKLLLTHGAKSTNSIDKFCYKNLCKLDANFQKILLEGMILPDKKTKDTYQQDDLRSIILYAKTLSQEMKESKNSNIVEYQALRNMHHSEEEPSSLFSFMYRKCTDEVMLKLKNLKNTDQSSIFHPDFFRLYDEALKKLVLDDFQNDLHALNYIYHFFHYFTEMNLEMWRDMSSMISSLRYHILYLKRNDVMTRFSSYTNAISVINQLCYQLSSQFVNFSDAELSQLTDPAGWTNPTIAFEISIFSSLFDFIFVKNHEGNFKSRLENPKKVELLLNYIFSESLNSRLGELHTQLKVIEKDCQSTAELKTFHLIDKSLSLQIIKNIIHDYPDDFASVLKDSYEKYPFIKNYKYQSDSFFYYDCRLTTLFNKSRSTQASLQILDKEIHEVRKL